MMKKGIQIKKFLLVAVALLFAVQMNLMDVNATSSGWSLRFTKGAPASDNITSWSKTIVTKKKVTTYLSVTSFSSDNSMAMAAASTNGTWLMVTCPVDQIAARTVKAGKSVTGRMKITNTSNLIYFKSAGKFYY